MLSLNCTHWQIRFQPWNSAWKGRCDLIGKQGLAEFKVHPCREIVHSRGPGRKLTPLLLFHSVSLY